MRALTGAAAAAAGAEAVVRQPLRLDVLLLLEILHLAGRRDVIERRLEPVIVI